MEPERKTRREEETAAIFGHTDEVMIFSEDSHVDHNTHELVVDVHLGAGAGGPSAEHAGKETRRCRGLQPRLGCRAMIIEKTDTAL